MNGTSLATVVVDFAVVDVDMVVVVVIVVDDVVVVVNVVVVTMLVVTDHIIFSWGQSMLL